MRVGTDSGGTFTDIVAEDGSIAKVLSTPAEPDIAVARGLDAVGQPHPSVLAHGTTVATNAVLEGKGAPVALITTAGFEDIIEIARQDRPSLYDAFSDRPVPLVPRLWRLGVTGRIDATGVELAPLSFDALASVPAEAAAVAICFLHADIDGSHEAAVAARLRADGWDVSASHLVSPEFREYERTVTTVINASLRPRCRAYLQRLEPLADEVAVMSSAGGLLDLAHAAELPAALLLSGPAGGVHAGAAAAVANGFPDAVTFDMGGTSTDVCLILDGRPAPAGLRSVGGYPVRLPSLDIETIGAGGGSLARLDSGGALVVGPESAGSTPGPASYGRGGLAPAVTDANLVLGRIPAAATFGDLGVLDLGAARTALDAAGVTAEGVIAVVNANMELALRKVTVQRGVDPRGLALVAFGGAGPLHACELADALEMAAVVVPARAGVLSAVGILAAPDQRDLVRSWPTPRDHARLAEALDELGAQAAAGLGEGPTAIEVECMVDCRYAGQSHEITVPTVTEFAAEHRRRNGYVLDDVAVEVIALRASARRPSPTALSSLPAPSREGAVGPSVIAEDDCTIWVPEGWAAEPGVDGALVLRRTGRTGAGAQRADEPVADAVLDAAALQVLIARLTGVAEEMSAVLRRASFSPNIKERADCSCALFTAAGQMLVQAENIPVHLGSMPASVSAAIERFAATIEPGQQVILNDPFAGGTHLNDITVVAPVFVDAVGGGVGRIVGWVANRAHHADVGGAAPGSLPADATEVFQEGLRIPPLLLTDEVRALVVANTRTPAERRGDLDAQIGANRVGTERLAAIASAVGPAPLAAVLDYGERRMAAALAAMPDGTWHFTDVIDSTGSHADQQVPATICAAMTIDGATVRFDFTGSAPQRAGNVNAPSAVTASAVAWALRSVADPTIPSNGGALRPLELVIPERSILSAEAPAAVGAGNVEVSQRVADVCLGALAAAVPDRVGAASQGTMNNVLIGGIGGEGAGPWVYYETMAGGQGARPGRDGMSGVHTAMTNTRNTPVEAFERAYPMRVRRLRLAAGSGGDGQFRGGDGIEREIELLEDAVVSLITERRTSQPWGLSGGGPGAVGENWRVPQGDDARAEPLPDKCTIRLSAGDVVRLRTPGGGGWGEH